MKTNQAEKQILVLGGNRKLPFVFDRLFFDGVLYRCVVFSAVNLSHVEPNGKAQCAGRLRYRKQAEAELVEKAIQYKEDGFEGFDGIVKFETLGKFGLGLDRDQRASNFAASEFLQVQPLLAKPLDDGNLGQGGKRLKSANAPVAEGIEHFR